MGFYLTRAWTGKIAPMTGVARKDVVGLLGGLGNQLFQLAYGLWLQAETGREVVYDLSAYRSIPDYYSLEQLGIHLTEISWLRAVPYPTGRVARLGRAVRYLAGPRRIVLEQSASSFADAQRELDQPSWRYGYWQHAEIASAAVPAIRALVAASTPDCGDLAPVGMHVRRGDMIGKSAAMAADWFPCAARRIIAENALPARTTIDVYTDSPAWVEEELGRQIRGLKIRVAGSPGGTCSSWRSTVIWCSPAAPFPGGPPCSRRGSPARLSRHTRSIRAGIWICLAGFEFNVDLG